MPSESHKSWLTDLAHRYHEELTEETRSYLAARALDRTAVDGALLGLVASPDPAHEPYRGRLSIPFITPTGVVQMRFRCLEDHDCKAEKCPKYLGVAGGATHLYNVQALHDADSRVGIAEGELDALVATRAGLPTVGCVGSENWKPFYYRLFDDFEYVYILGDGDTAGRKWAGGLSSTIPGAVSRVQPAGYDVTSFVTEFGTDAFMSMVQQ
jgi:hypothetical protein